MQHSDDAIRKKHLLRAEAHLRRLHLADSVDRSGQVFARLAALPEYAAARSVLCYVSVRSEVLTRAFMVKSWELGKRVFVPYCEANDLKLFHLTSFDDLAPGTLGIPEPKLELRSDDRSRAATEELDFFVIPGLAFDARCGRLGYGKGYFDRLLRCARPDALLAGVAFDCQIFDEVPMMPHDVRLDAVVAESDTYRRELPR